MEAEKDEDDSPGEEERNHCCSFGGARADWTAGDDGQSKAIKIRPESRNWICSTHLSPWLFLYLVPWYALSIRCVCMLMFVCKSLWVLLPSCALLAQSRKQAHLHPDDVKLWYRAWHICVWMARILLAHSFLFEMRWIYVGQADTL